MLGTRLATAFSVAAAAVGLASGGNAGVAHADCIATGSFGCSAPTGPVVHPGDMIQTDDEMCSVGIIAKMGPTAYAVTAGHCYEAGAPVSNAAGDRIGVFDAGVPDTGTTFQQARFGFGLVRLTGGAQPSGSFDRYKLETIDFHPHEGEQVCKVGARTGLSCGTIAAVGGQHIVVRGINLDHGDSGGIVFRVLPDGNAAFVGIVEAMIGGHTGDMDVEAAGDLGNQINGLGRGPLNFYSGA